MRKESCKCIQPICVLATIGGLFFGLFILGISLATFRSGGGSNPSLRPANACWRAEQALQQEFDLWYNSFSFFYEDGDNASLDNYALNEMLICEHNLLNLSYSLGHNQFSGMNSSQFEAWLKRGALDIEQMANASFYYYYSGAGSAVAPETSVDWTSRQTAVKNQGACGSCYAYVATELVENLVSVRNNNSYEELLSVEAIIDCDMANHGCGGGGIDTALQYVQAAGGLATEAAYPSEVSVSTGNAGTCASFTPEPGTLPSNIFYVNATSDAAVVEALQTTVIGIAFISNTPSFQLYSGGIFTGADCTGDVDHAMLMVGYDATTYKLRNQWGENWGEQGYIRVARKAGDTGNGVCNILKYSGVVVID